MRRIKLSSAWRREGVVTLGVAAAVICGALWSSLAYAYPRPGTLELISKSTSGALAEGPWEPNFPTDVTPDGRYVVFQGWSQNLAPEHDDGRVAQSQVFIRDRALGTTELASVNAQGAKANSHSGEGAITPDGRYVVFSSLGQNMAPGFSNGAMQVYLRDRTTGDIERVSVNAAGEAGQAPGDFVRADSEWPVITPDARFVAFESRATNLVPLDTTNYDRDVFVRDRQEGIIERVSVATGGDQIVGDSMLPRISANGRFIAFQSDSPNLPGGGPSGTYQAYVHDRETDETVPVSVSSDGAVANGYSHLDAMTPDGRYFVFNSAGNNLVPYTPQPSAECNISSEQGILCDESGTLHVYVHDRETGVTKRASTSSAGVQGDMGSAGGYISADGRYVVFLSVATNLVPDGPNGQQSHMFVHDMVTGATEWVSTSGTGAETGVICGAPSRISATGRFVAFWCGSRNLTPDDTNEEMDVFLRDRGPTLGIGKLEANKSGSVIYANGWATFAGIAISEATDPADDAGERGSEDGAELTGSQLIARPELEDHLIKLFIDHAPPRGAPGQVYGIGFVTGGTRYEIRGSVPSPQSPDFGLYECASTCSRLGSLDASYGSVGDEIWIALPDSLSPAVAGASITALSAFVGPGTPAAGVVDPADEVAMPDALVPEARVEVELVPAEASTTTSPVRALLDEGSFQATIDAADLPPGEYELRARACTTTCSPDSVLALDSVVDGGTSSPSPSSSVTPTPEPSPPVCGTYPTVPDDPYFGAPDAGLFDLQQWAPRLIAAPNAWAHATGCEVTVAVIDSGIDLDHEDLQCPGKLAEGAAVIDGDIKRGAPADDIDGHGTHVAGIIAACTDNAVGTVGIAPDATLMPYRAFPTEDEGTGVVTDIAVAIRDATDRGAHVINMSLSVGIGGLPVTGAVGYLPGLVPEIDDALDYAHSQGVVVVAAAGNDAVLPLCEYPAIYEDVVCVGATDNRDLKSWYSTFPNKPDNDDDFGPAVVAPGGAGQPFCDVHSEEILSTYPVEFDGCDEGAPGFRDLNGTSMASPHVAGVAALVYDRLGATRSAANAATVIDTIISSAVDLGPPGYDPVFGSGRVNALAAVQAVTPEPDPTVSPTPSESATPDPTPTATASPTPTESPSPSPSESPEPETTTVTFTENSAQSGQYSDEALFEARLTDSNGDPIADQELTFDLTGTESSRGFSAMTDEDGVAAVTPILQEKPGTHQLTVRFAGDEEHAADADTASFIVDKEDSALQLSVHGEDDDKTLRARLSDLDTSSEGIAERTVRFYSDGELIGSHQTDADGVASAALPPRHRGNNRTYEAVFEGDDFYLGSSDERAGKGNKGGNGGRNGSGGESEGGRTHAGRMLLM